jgi:hypothetical protein
MSRRCAAMHTLDDLALPAGGLPCLKLSKRLVNFVERSMPFYKQLVDTGTQVMANVDLGIVFCPLVQTWPPWLKVMPPLRPMRKGREKPSKIKWSRRARFLWSCQPRIRMEVWLESAKWNLAEL